jgi:hypothetical protein
MTNAKYHRCRLALERLDRRELLSLGALAEQRQLRSLVTQYRQGGLRAKNGRGSGLHSSNAVA